jgi:ABC-type lipoprotein release transport system permease subunit
MKLIWRNIWRNRRRTIITTASVFFAAFSCILFMSFDQGTWDRMIDNMIGTQAGHIQIHGKGYWDDKIIDNFMFMDAAAIAELENIDNIANVSPRVETFAMASFETASKGIAVIGVSPEKEALKSNLPARLVKGEYLMENDNGILIGEGLSKFLKAGVGDTLALIGQGYHGASAAQLFIVRGTLKLMTAEMDNAMAYITLPAAQQFIDMPDGYSGILITIKDNYRLNETMEVVSYQLSVSSRHAELDSASRDYQGIADQVRNDGYELLPWHFTLERVLQTAESDKAFSYLIMLILYVIVGFGIFGTVIMMTNERKREFCMMISLGMSRMRLASLISVELFIKSLMGAVLAIVVALPVTHWFHANPIRMSDETAEMFFQFGMEPVLPMSVHAYIFTAQITAVLAISLLAVIYPVRKIMKLELRGNK